MGCCIGSTSTFITANLVPAELAVNFSFLPGFGKVVQAHTEFHAARPCRVYLSGVDKPGESAGLKFISQN
jgi:hypothetical protein